MAVRWSSVMLARASESARVRSARTAVRSGSALGPAGAGLVDGLAEIRAFFMELLEGRTKGFLGAFKMKRAAVTGELAYIVWEAKPWFTFATDTILVRDGKIVLQTFAAHPAREA